MNFFKKLKETLQNFSQQNKKIKFSEPVTIFEQRFRKRKPGHKFIRQDRFRFNKLEAKWRRPRGLHSKMRRSLKNEGLIPKTGYGTPKRIRHKLRNGFMPKLVHNMNELQMINSKKEAVVFSKRIGLKKILEFYNYCRNKNIRIVNLRTEI
jgi:large subunit ribosomal protein L32e